MIDSKKEQVKLKVKIALLDLQMLGFDERQRKLLNQFDKLLKEY